MVKLSPTGIPPGRVAPFSPDSRISSEDHLPFEPALGTGSQPPTLEAWRMGDEYKAAKEAFYQGHSGGSSLEIQIITAVPPFSIFLAQAVGISLGSPPSGPVAGLLATLCTTLPLYASFVVPHQALRIIFIQVLASILVIFALGSGIRTTVEALDSAADVLNRPQKSFLVSYRGMMMLATCLAILAVDFQTFPRRLAKTETFGVSLMDAGVGSVLLSQAIVSPLARKPSTAMPKRFLSALLSSSPLLVIGGVRLLGTRAADYHEHASEYGVHWNFFFTLASVSTVCNVLPLTGWKAAVAGVALSVGYEGVLKGTGLEDWVLNAPRQDLLSANREGLLGCIGYASVFYAGVALGGFVFGGGGGRDSRRRTGGEWVRFTLNLGGLSLLLWGCVFCLQSLDLRVSRRLVNLPYVIWTLAYNCSTLFLFTLLEIVLHFIAPLAKGGEVSAWRGEGRRQCEVLSDAINRNQLFLFLISNLLTGLVNLTLPTLYATSFQAHITMVLYSLLITAVAMVLDNLQVTLKYW